ncbi:hypothetical protein BDF20DRAFT_838576 [Mycotypha africana]|uniref:uncharacterized protein n=1 Tax=Mycotypha africana TaxID=64632 RepID=UPI00230135D1|nr:uncharacterized protein BDF20DRAFT_838576 [Mycotypha africana]KAI8970197.1 hypothetical protein BDF20DRAFT_838576 [Mycotypha africana]
MEEARRNQLVVLAKRIKSADDKINECLKKLGWERAELLQWYKKQSQSLSKCPINNSHVVPTDSLQRHSNICLLKTKGFDVKPSERKRKTAKYNRRPLSSLFFYEQSSQITSFLGPPPLASNLKSTSLPDERKYLINTTILNESSSNSHREVYDKIVAESNQIKLQRSNKQAITTIDRQDLKSGISVPSKKRVLETLDEKGNKRRSKQYRYRLKKSMSQSEVSKGIK